MTLPPLPALPSLDLLSAHAPLWAQLVVAVPAVAAVLGLFLRRTPRLAATVAVGGAVLMLLAAVLQLLGNLGGAAGVKASTVGPLPVGELQVPLRLLGDDLAVLVALAVALVGAAVQAFARWYLRRDDRYAAFAASVSLFCAGMLLVVQSADLVLTLVGWEVMGWCSYLLIGHDTRREAARRAAVKAFLVTRVADLAFVIGIVMLAVGAGTSDIPQVLRHWSGVANGQGDHGGAATLTAALLCLLCGIAGKSAQFPFQDWLPDAMEGPTPASALIHAATMVAAGSYLVARLFTLFAASDTARLVLGVVAAVTMVGAAVLAFGQSDLKRLLAWSTVSQVAIMLAALAAAPAAAGPGAGILHLLSHAMFKSLLFLALGWLSVLVGGTAAATMTGGVRHHPALAAPIGIGLLALAGVPPLMGFVSKELVLSAAENGVTHGNALTGWVVFAAVAATVPLTAAYCMRAWLVLTHLEPQERVAVRAERAVAGRAREVRIAEMFGPETFEAGPAPASRVSLPWDAGRAIGVLAAASVVGGLVVFTPLLRVDAHLRWWVAGSSVLLIAAAALTVRFLSPDRVRGDAAARLRPRLAAGFDNGWGMDRVYLALVARPVTSLARLVVVLDRDVIDGYVRGTVVATRLAGAAGERAHTRRPSSNLVWLLLGVLAAGVAGVSLW